MKKSRFTETQIVSVLKEADAGMKVEELCRRHGISSATYYNWKKKYGGMDASEIKRLKELEEENAKLKRMYAAWSACAGPAITVSQRIGGKLTLLSLMQSTRYWRRCLELDFGSATDVCAYAAIGLITSGFTACIAAWG